MPTIKKNLQDLREVLSDASRDFRLTAREKAHLANAYEEVMNAYR